MNLDVVCSLEAKEPTKNLYHGMGNNDSDFGLGEKGEINAELSYRRTREEEYDYLIYFSSRLQA